MPGCGIDSLSGKAEFRWGSPVGREGIDPGGRVHGVGVVDEPVCQWGGEVPPAGSLGLRVRSGNHGYPCRVEFQIAECEVQDGTQEGSLDGGRSRGEFVQEDDTATPGGLDGEARGRK